jgi:16S rRNA (cytidine1402-2'-O)-methyltransferase
VACRELTKTHEEIRRGTLAELREWAAGTPLGEVTLVVAGAPAAAGAMSLADAVTAVAAKQAQGMPRKLAIAAVVSESGLRRRDIYNAVVAAPGD